MTSSSSDIASASAPAPRPPAAGRSRVLRRFLADVIRRRPRTFALALGLSIAAASVEGIGLLMLLPLMQLVGLGRDGAVSTPIGLLGAGFTAFGSRLSLPIVLVLYVLVMALHARLSRWQTTTTLGLEQEVATSLRRDLYAAISNARWVLFSQSRSSEFTHALTLEVDRSAAATSQIVILCAGTGSTLAYFTMALAVSPAMTALVSACAGGVLLSLRAKAQGARVAGEALSRATTDLYDGISEHIGSLKTTRSYGAETRHATQFDKLTRAVEHAYGEAVRDQSDVKYRFDVSCVIVLAVVVYVGVARLAIPVPEILFLLFLFARLMPRLSSLRHGYQVAAHLLPAFASITALQARFEAAANRKALRAEAIAFRRTIRFEHVDFTYRGRPAIRDLDFVIHARQTTAIVGPSGAGKSTVADLIMGLIAPDRGRLLIDDVPLGPEHLESWREQIGYVAQDTFLFHDTVRANLLWAKPDASQRELDEALGLAAAEEFVSALPNGLDTMLGDRGVLISGGERQRLALARALLRRPSLLILDEATSAIDVDNERRIREAIAGLSGLISVVMITHRLSAIRDMDVIHVFEEGRVTETGTYDALTRNEDGPFRALGRTPGQPAAATVAPVELSLSIDQ